MKIRTTASYIEVQTPAKVNLFFEVLARRDDGYHEIESLMCPLDWYDTLSFTRLDAPRIVLTQRWALGLEALARRSHGALPEPRHNLAYRAVELLRERSGVRLGGQMHLIKRIPTSAGLGGGSSDAAAALVAANEAWGLGWSRQRLAELGGELGSDVPFFLDGGAAVCRGRGERIEPIGPLGRWHLVVVRPHEGLSTAAVYARCRPAQSPGNVQPLIAALRAGRWDQVRRTMYNALETPAGELSPWVGRIRSQLQREDLVAFQMSGSGTSFFGVCRHARHARCVAQRLRNRGLGLVMVTCNRA